MSADGMKLGAQLGQNVVDLEVAPEDCARPQLGQRSRSRTSARQTSRRGGGGLDLEHQ